jgi:N12 class adenine-specific DNA methylase/DNA repair protein RadC
MAALSDRTIKYYDDLIKDNPDRDRAALVEGIKHFHRKGNKTQFYPTVNKLEYEGRKRMDLNEAQVQEKKDGEPGDTITGLKRGIQTTQAMLYGSTALVGRAMEGIGMDDTGAATKAWGLKGYTRNMAESEKYKAKYSFKDVYTGKAGFGGAVDWAQGTLGELAPSMAEAAVGTLIGTLAAPGAGTAIGAFGARTLLKKSINKLTKEAIESGVKGVTESQLKKQITGQALKKLGGRVGMGAAVMPLETGGMYAGLLEEHGVDAPFTALLFGAAATSFEFFGGNSRLIDNLVGAIGKGQSGLIKRTAKEILKGVPEEAFQEGAQEIMSILNTVVNTDEKLLTTENFEAIVESAAAGAVGGGAGAVVSGVLSKGAKDNEIDKKTGDDTKGPSDAEKILMDDEDLGKSAEDFLKDDIMEQEDDVRAASEFTDEELDQVVSKPDVADVTKKEEKPSEKLSSGQTVSWVNSSGKTLTGTVDSLGANGASVTGKDGKKYRPRLDKLNVEDTKDQTPNQAESTQQEKNQAIINQQSSDAELASDEKAETVDKQTEKDDSDFQFKIDQMQGEVNSTETGGVTQAPVNQQGETVVYSANSPDWMRQLQADRKTDKKKALSRKELNVLLDKVRSGKPLTDIQQDKYSYLERAIASYAGAAGELVANDELADLEKRGFDPLGGQEISVANLNEGDKIVGTVDGVKDEYEVKDTNDQGETLLQDGVSKRVDMFDQVTVDGIKRADQSNDAKTSNDVPETDLAKKTEPEQSKAAKKPTTKTDNGDPQVEKSSLEQKDISLSTDKTENKLPAEFSVVGKNSDGRELYVHKYKPWQRSLDDGNITHLSPGSLKTAKELYDAGEYRFLTNEELNNFQFSPGKTVSWKTKKGKEIFATLVRKDKNDRWYVEKSDGKKTIVAQKTLTLSDNLVKSDKKASIETKQVKKSNSKEESEPKHTLLEKNKDSKNIHKDKNNKEKTPKKREDEFSPDNLLAEWDKQAKDAEKKEKAVETKQHLSNAMDKFKKINDILGERGSFSNKETDENIYAQIRPLLQEALDDVLKAGKSASEYVALAIDSLSTKARPYFERFVKTDMSIEKDPQKDYTENKKSKKESSNDTDDAGRTATRETKKGHDRGSHENNGSKAAPESEEKSVPEKVFGDERKSDNGSVPGGKRSVHNKPGKKRKAGGRSDTADSKNRDETETNLGDNAGTVSGIRRRDYRIKPGTLSREGSWRKSATNNLDAIDLLKKINKEQRSATSKEQKILAKYVGWGASELANSMFPGYAETGKINLYQAKEGWKSLVQRVEKTLNPEELKTAAKSTKYAHYTNEPIIKSIYKALSRMGFTGGKILEPGMGIGNFVGLLPDEMQKNSVYTGIEMDHVSAGIAKLLYPNQNMMQADFTSQSFPPNFFDAAIGNPPFGKLPILADPEYKKYRFALHNYFFAKAIDRVKPGGLLVFVTSRYTMDAGIDKARQYIADRADLLGAIRLPQTAFKQSAGTEVVTDVLFLKKKEEGAKPGGKPWTGQKEVKIGDEKKMINEYFVKHPSMVLGTHSTEGSMYSNNEYTVLPADGKIEDHFSKAIKKLPSNVYDSYSKKNSETYNEQTIIDRDFNPKNKKEGGIYLSDDGHLMKVDFGSGAPIENVHKNIPKKTIGFLKSYIKLRDALKLSHKAQLEDGDWEPALEALNKEYDKFVKRHGRVTAFVVTMRAKENEDGTKEKVAYHNLKNQKAFDMDAESSLVVALEKVTQDGKIVKSNVLQGRTINKPKTPVINSIPDALAVSLDLIGKLDVDHVAKTAKKTKEEIIGTLGDLIYDNPDGTGHVMADEYLSGNVVRKLAEAKAAAKLNPDFERNVAALKESQPEPLKPEHISITPGAPWVPLQYYNEFATKALGMPATVVEHQPADNSWKVIPAPDTRPSYMQRGDKRGYKPQGLRSSTNEWGTIHRGPNELFEAILNNRSIRITRTVKEDGRTRTEFLVNETAAANEIVKKMRARFSSWVWEDAERASDLLGIYNTKINTIKGREFDGSHLTLPGLSNHFKPYDHQKRGIWRILQTGNTYLNHAVGAGKTFVMIAAGMEMRRLGMINKPLYVVPNHMLGQFSQEFQEIYPMANVMVAGKKNFHTENRRRFVAQAALNDPDAIILTHSSFGLLRVKEETLAPVRDNFLSQMRYALSEMEDDDMPRMTIKRMEARIESAEQRFAALVSGGDNAISFEELGADFMFIDEAHEFRKLDFVTNRQMKGIDPNGSKRAIDLFIKTLWLDGQNKGRSHSFASGTPITNTLGELYTLMRFFSGDQMEEDGIAHFDSWANMFGEPATAYEMNAAGNHVPVERFANFVNVPELMSRVRMFMDVLTSSQLGTRVTRPDIKDNAPKVVLAPKNSGLQAYQDGQLNKRIEISKKWKPSKEQPGNPDPMINIITDGKLASIDMRFVDPDAVNDPTSKLNVFIDGIIKTYHRTKDTEYAMSYGSMDKSPVKGGSQIVFYNNGFGKGVIDRRGFDSKAFLMKRLKKAGVPANHVGWIDDYKTPTQKETLFKAVRDGKKRILLGSAKKMGTGVNAQNRLTDLHYLDAPWYPADVEQPDGRIIRQGNQNKEVGINRYATEGSYDATLWQMVARKARAIDQAFAGDKDLRRVEDVSEASQYEMAAALASGDERVVELVRLRADIDGLLMLSSAHSNNQRSLVMDKRKLEYNIRSNQGRLEEFKEMEPHLPDYIGAEIEGKVGEKKFEKRKEFGAALIVRIRKALNGKISGTFNIGSVNGVTINVDAKVGKDAILNNAEIEAEIKDIPIPLKGLFITPENIKELDAVGLTQKITNVINKLPSVKSKIETDLLNSQKELDRVNKRFGAPFEHAKELSEKIAEANSLEKELAREENEVEKEGSSDIIEEFQRGLFSEKAEQLDLFEYKPDRLQKIKVPGRLRTKQDISAKPIPGVDISKNRYIVQTPEDAASLLSHLVVEPQEQACFLSIDKNGNVLEVLKHTTGTKGSSLIDGITAIARSFNVGNVKKIVFAHNHPSGGLKPSASDKQILIKLKSIAALRDIPILPLIIGNKEYAIFGEHTGTPRAMPIKKTVKKTHVLIKERVFTKRVKSTDTAFESQAQAIKRFRDEEDGFLLLNGQNQEVGFLPFPSGFSQKEITAQVLEAIEKTNTSAILINNKPLKDATGRAHFLTKLSDALLDNQILVFDIFSYSKTGTIRQNPQDVERKPFYNIDNLNNNNIQFSSIEDFTDQTPGQGVTLPDIQKRFTGQDVFISKDGSVSIYMRNGKGLKIVSMKKLPDDEFQFAIRSGRMKKDGVILGSYKDGTIRLNEDLSSEFALSHETYHALRDLGMITNSDRAVLTGLMHEWNSQGKLETNLTKNKEENEANAFAQFLKERKDFRGTAMGRIIQKVMDFLDGLRYIGRMSARKLAREVESGKIFKRKANPKNSSNKRKFQTSDDFKKGPESKVSKIKSRFNKKDAGYESDQFKDILPKNVAKAMQKGRGIKKSTLLDKFNNFKTDMKMEMDHFPELTRMEPGKQRSSAREILRRHQDISNIVQDKAARKMSGMLNNLNKQEYDMFAMELILGDEVRSINDGLRTDYNLPWGFETMDQVIESHKKIQSYNRKNKKVAKAIEDRRKFHKGLARDLVKYGVMKKEILKSGDYFHHQILLYWNEKAKDHHKGMGTSSSEIRTKWRPWMTARKGSPLEYNTEYMEAEYIATSQQMALIEIAKNLAQIKKENDILKDLQLQAKAENKAIYDKWVALQKKNDLNFEDPAKPHVTKIAMGFSNLAQAVKTGKITYDSEFQDVVDAILIAIEERKINKEAWMEAVDDNPKAGLVINHPRLFPFLSHLIEKQHQGSMYAGMIYKGIKGRDRVVKEVLGTSFKTWKQIIPKGYKEWKPDPNKGAFFVNSITDQVLQNVLAGEKTLEDKDVRKVLARGNPPLWILPEGLADTMDNLRPHNAEGRLARTSEVAMAAWKQYILLNPFSALKYNINNMSGDLDIVLAYRPEIVKPKALKKSLGDLINWSRYKKLNPQLKIELEEAQKHGVIGSGFAVQEVTDTMKIMTTNTFVKDILTEEKLGLAASYWKHIKNASQTRENVLRLAAFRWFKKQLESGKSVYGASKIDDVNNLVEQGKITETAAKLARELLGDYGNISRHGEFIRRRMIPFYSWIEINAPRYAYLMKNLKYEGETTKRLSFTFARRGVVFAVKASMLAGAVMLFNALVFPDELDDLGPEKRRQMHLILGRREDGSIITLRFQGALSDALSWFAKEDLPSDIKDLMQGKSTIQEQLMDIPKAVLNKTVSGIRPDVKMLFETLTGLSTYPDATSPKPIRDKVENILKTFKLDIFYRKAMGRPGRGRNMAEHFLSDLLSITTYTTEPGVQAYYDTRKLVFKWKEKNGTESGGGKPTKKGNAFYYYRQALKYGDLVAAKKYLQKYYDLGGTAKGKRSAIRLAHPLAGIKKTDRYKFKKTLLPAEKKRLEHAIKWYTKTYVEKGREVSK